MLNYKYFLTAFLLLLLPRAVYAHCPLCTVGAGALAVLASSIGVSTAAIGVFVGAFAVALGLWVSKYVKNYIKGQKWLLAIASFVLTIWPITPLMTQNYWGVNVYWIGEFGGILNRTYVFNWFVIGSVVGAVMIVIAPLLSQQLTRFRGKNQFPYQGLTITFLTLLTAALIFQFSLA